MSERRYVTVDVFTDQPFGGNPLAVVLDAQGLKCAAMQSIAKAFNDSETTFVLPQADPAHLRIFTPVEHAGQATPKIKRFMQGRGPHRAWAMRDRARRAPGSRIAQARCGLRTKARESAISGPRFKMMRGVLTGP